MSMCSEDCITNCKLPDLIENLDLISNLPDAIISKILSCVHTKDAVGTCVLSKSWEFKWTSCLNVMNVDDDDIDDDGDIDDEPPQVSESRIKSFISYVYRILDLSENFRLTSFRLVCRRKYDPYHLNKWIGTVLNRKVENLNITNLQFRETLVFPECNLVSSYNSLKFLRIWSLGTLKIPHENCFSHLEKLCICCTYIEVQELRSNYVLLLDFPVLQELELWSCKWFNVMSVEIRAPVLIRFKIWSDDDFLSVSNYEMKISAPKLAKFQSCGPGLMGKLVLNSPSVTYISLDHNYCDENTGLLAHTILKAAPLLNRLELSGEVVETLFVQAKLGLVIPSFDRLKQLDLCSSYDTKKLFQLLEMVPSLESLSLDLNYWRNDDYGKLEPLPACLVSRINEVKLKDLKGGCEEMQLAEFILKSANKLEKLLVMTNIEPLKPMIEIECELSRLHKSSSSVSIVVKQMRYTHDF